MKKYGFIGYGNIGSMLVSGFLDNNFLEPEQIVLSNRNQSKLKKPKNKWPQVNIVNSNKELAKESSYIFICVEPLDIKDVLNEIKNDIKKSDHIISVAAGVTLSDIEASLPEKTMITKVIPSVTSRVNIGVSLICHNSLVNDSQNKEINDLFNTIGNTKIIKETNFEAAADATNPGFLAFILEKYTESLSNMNHHDLTKKEIEELVTITLYGMINMVIKNKNSLSNITSMVATEGGITEQGVNLLESELGLVFDELFISTFKKHDKIKKIIKEQFYL